MIFLSTPLISRFYTPTDLGDFHWFVSFSTFISIVLSLQLNQKISSVPHAEVNNFLLKAWSIIFFNHILAGILVCAFYFSDILDIEVLFSIIFSFILSINNVSAVINILFSRVKIFFAAAMARALSLVSIQAALPSFVDAGSESLIVSVLLAELISFLVVHLGTKERIRVNIRLIIIFYDKEVLNYARYVTLGAIFSYAVNFIPTLIMKASGDLVGLGFFAMCYKLIAIPMYAISNSARPVYFNWLMKKTEPAGFHFNFILASSSIFVFLGAMIYKFVPADMYAWLLGHSWTGIGNYLGVTFIWIGLSFANVFNQELLRCVGKLKFLFFSDLAAALIKLMPLIFFTHNDLALTFLVCAAVSTAMTSFVNLRKVINCLEK